MVSFLVDMFKLKAPFLTKNSSAELSEKLELCKVVCNQNYTDKANANVPLTVEIV